MRGSNSEGAHAQAPQHRKEPGVYASSLKTLLVDDSSFVSILKHLSQRDPAKSLHLGASGGTIIGGNMATTWTYREYIRLIAHTLSMHGHSSHSAVYVRHIQGLYKVMGLGVPSRGSS